MDIVKSFHSNDLTKEITIIGTPEDPLFKANDIAELLDFSNIRVVLADFDESEKRVCSTYTIRGYKDVNYLTEKGLYKVLFKSRKPIAVQFQNWVFEVIKEIRKNGSYTLQQQLEEIEAENNQLKIQNQHLIDEVQRVTATDGQKVIYIYDTDARVPLSNNKRTLKIGVTEHLQKRIKPYKQVTPYGRLIFHVECSFDNLRTAEQWLHGLLKPFRQMGEVFEIELDIAKKWLTLVSNVITISNNLDHTEMEQQLSKMVDLSNTVLEKNVGKAAYAEVCTQTEEVVIHDNDEDQSNLKVNVNDDYTVLFNKFVDECCLLDVVYEVSSKDITGKFRLWSRTLDKNTFYALNEYLRTRFRPIRMHSPGKKDCVHGYRGLKLKDIEVPPLPFAPSDPQLFVAHACVFSPSGRTLMKDMIEEYTKWGQSVGKQVNSKDIKEYLKDNSSFILVGNVWTAKGNGQGYYGISFKHEEEKYKQVRTVGKTVTKYDTKGNIVATWDTIAKAAEDEGMPACKLSHIIRDKKELNGFRYSASYKT